MGKIWVLDTETKGTGATVVPLEKVLKQPAAADERVFVPRESEPRPERAPEPKSPRTFKVVDLMTREVLAEGASTRETVEVLSGVRSIVDVSIFVWQPQREQWRALSLREERVLWQLRDRARRAAADDGARA
jgi:hypothetical protein